MPEAATEEKELNAFEEDFKAYEGLVDEEAPIKEPAAEEPPKAQDVKPAEEPEAGIEEAKKEEEKPSAVSIDRPAEGTATVPPIKVEAHLQRETHTHSEIETSTLRRINTL